MIDSIETLLRSKQETLTPITVEESAYIKRILKELCVAFPREWDEALEDAIAKIVESDAVVSARLLDETKRYKDE